MKGPILTAANSGVHIPNRDHIWAKLQETEEGSLFRAKDIVGDDVVLRSNFDALEGYDYLNVTGDLHTAVIETPYLRHWPHTNTLVSSYTDMRQETAVPTGDRIAYILNLRPWETLGGIRFYTDGEDAVIKNGRAKIHFIHAPSWLRKTDRTSILLRVFHDQAEKTLAETCTRAIAIGGYKEAELIAVCDLADRISDEHFTHDDREKSSRIIDPAFISSGVREWLSTRLTALEDVGSGKLRA